MKQPRWHRPGQFLARQKTGFILPLSIALMYAMLILTLALAQQQQAHTGFTQLNEFQADSGEGAEAGFSSLQGILQDEAEGNPPTIVTDPGSIIQGGIIPPTGGSTATITASPAPPNPNGPPPPPLTLIGNFNGAPNGFPATDASFLRPVPPMTGPNALPTADGYGDAENPGPAFAVPARHMRVVELAQVQTQIRQPVVPYFSVYSTNFPFGLFTPNGQIEIQNATATADFEGIGDSGLPVNFYALGDINVGGGVGGGYLNGNAYSPNGTINLAGFGGMKFQGPAAPVQSTFPTDLTNGSTGTLDVAITQLTASQNSPLDNALNGIFGGGGLLNANILGQATAALVTVPGGLNLSGNTFQVGTIPGSSLIALGSMETSHDVDISFGNLMLADNVVLKIDGNLTVGSQGIPGTGHVYMGQNTSLIVGGNMTMNNTLDITNEPAVNTTSAGITNTVLVNGNINLQSGMSHTPGVTNTSFLVGLSVLGSFEGAANPFSVLSGFPPGPNPLNLAFAALEQAAPGQATNLIFGNPTFQLSIFIGPAPSDNHPIGALIVSQTGSITLSGGQVDGLVIAQQGAINMASGCACANGPLQHLVGAAWARNGIVGSQTNFRYFPYYTHAFAQASAGAFQVGAFRAYRTAYGRLP